MADMEKAIVDLERAYWREAIELFKEKSDRDEKSTDSFLQEWDRPEKVKLFFEDTRRRADKEYSPRFARILEKVEVAMSAGDIAMKGAPESVGLAWMGVRMCLSTLSDDHATFGIFGQASMDIMGIMISCSVFSKLYGPSRDIEVLNTKDLHSEITSRIPKVYAAILDFSFAVKKYKNQHRGERLFRALLRSATEKFGEKLKVMQGHDEQMSKFATIASQQLSDHNQKTMHESQDLMAATLRDIKTQLGDSLRLRDAQTEEMRAYLRNLITETQKDMTPHEVALRNFEQNMLKLKTTSNQRAELGVKIALRSPEQTCTWIFDQPAFCNWCDSANSAMLWISGGPGFGKSILMAAIINELQGRATEPESTRPVVVFFFCNRGAKVTRETNSILNHLLSQVYEHLKDSPTETLDKANKLVAQRLGTGGQHRSETAGDNAKSVNVVGSEFANVFRGLAALLNRPVFAIVDALDECTDRTTGLVETLSAIVDMDSASPGPKIVICSRPEQDIQDMMNTVPTILVENNNGPDIAINAEHQLSDLPGWSAQERSMACQKIVTQAGSYFRYVDLALAFLKQPWQRPLSKHLERLPEGVNAFYEQIIQTTPPAYTELLRYSLTWTILGGGSVRVPEVIDAYSQLYTSAESLEHDTDEEERSASDLQIHQIQSASANLLLVDPTSLVMQQRHSTVSDYFLSRSQSKTQESMPLGPTCANCEQSLSTDKRFDISEKAGHLLIASTILKHLMNKGFHQRHLVPFEINSPNEITSPDVPNASTLVEAEPAVDVGTDSGTEQKSTIVESSTQSSGQTQDGEDATQTHTDLSTEEKHIPAAAASEKDTIELNPNPETSEAEKKESEETFDVASEIGTVADSDVDQGDPVYQAFDSKLPDKFRYEVNYCTYHLTKVEELWKPEDRHGSAWDEFELLRDAFFKDDSVFFQSWSKLLQQVPWGWSWPTKALHCAARLGLTSLVQRLIANGANYSERNNGENVLDYAIQYYANAKEDSVSRANCLCLFETLLRSGIDVNMRGENDFEFLAFRFLLVQNPDLDAVELFLKHGADAKAVNNGSLFSVLHTCVQFSDKPEVLRVILSNGADPNAKESGGETPLHSLMQRQEVPAGFLQQLLDAKADVNAEDLASQRPLFELCSVSGNVAAARLLVECEADVMDIDVNAQTALHLACENDHKDLVVFLIEKGAKVDALDSQNRTPFFRSCCAERDETALYLIEHTPQSEANVLKLPSKDGKTPLRKAAAKGHESIVRALFEKVGYDGSILDEQDGKYQQTALHVAARNGRKGVVEYLLKNKASASLKDKFGRTALAACLSGWMPSSSGDHQAVCTLLIDANDDDDDIENGILQGAAMKGVLPILQKLLDKGADPNRPDEHGWTAIQTAKQYGNMEAVKLLSSHNVSTALRPTRLRLAKRQSSASTAQGGDNSGLTAVDCMAIADHPVPADIVGFYYEISLERSTGASGSDQSACIGLCAHQSPKRQYWIPGYAPYQSWGWEGELGQLASYPSANEADYQSADMKFSKADVVGCGLDTNRQSLFFTRNGKLMSRPTGIFASTYYAFTGISGRLYPVVVAFPGTTIIVNFGNDKEKPFTWLPGNHHDGGVSHVVEEEGDLKKTLPRRATTAL